MPTPPLSRRCHRLSCWVCLILLAAISSAKAQSTQAISAEDFLNHMGVNTHFRYASYGHPDLPDAVADIGFRFVRDNGNATSLPKLNYLYNTYGIKALYALDSTSASISTIKQYLEEDCFYAIQGLNEPDNWSRQYKGMLDLQYTLPASRLMQHDLAQMIADNPSTLANKLLICPPIGNNKYAGAFGLLPFDVKSVHYYFPGTHPSRLTFVHDQIAPIPNSAGKPFHMTETGYFTATSSTDTRYVPLDVQAKYLVRVILASYQAGLDRMFIYELADQSNDLSDRAKNYGLIHYQPNPSQPLTLKPSGAAIRRLFDHLDDSTSPSFTPGYLDFRYHSGSSDVSSIHSMVIQENDANGTMNLLLWQEVSCYDAPNEQTITVNPISTTIQLNDSFSSAVVYTLDSDSAQQTLSNPTIFTLNITDQVTLIQLTPTTSPSQWPPVVEVTTTDNQAIEGSTNKGQFQFTRTGGDTTQPLNIYLDIDGTAILGTDYQTISTTLTFPANITTVTLDIDAGGSANDSTIEGPEYVTLRIWNNSNYRVGEKRSADITIFDDEAMADVIVTDIQSTDDIPVPGSSQSFVVTIKNQGTTATTSKTDIWLQPHNLASQKQWTSIPAGLAAGASTQVTMPNSWTAVEGNAALDATIASTSDADNTNNELIKILSIPYVNCNDDFESGLDQTPWDGWQVTGTWNTATFGSNTVIVNGDSYTSAPIVKLLPTNFASCWQVSFDYDWKWAGFNDNYGFYQPKVHLDMLDLNGNGLRVTVHQGDNNNSVNTNKTIEVFTVTSFVAGSTAIAAGEGYNQSGYLSAGLSEPRLKNVTVEYDLPAKQLRVYGDRNFDGQRDLFVTADIDLSSQSIGMIRWDMYSPGYLGLTLDNIHAGVTNRNVSSADNFNSQTVSTTPTGWNLTGTWQVTDYVSATDLSVTCMDSSYTSPRYISRSFADAIDGDWQLQFDYEWGWGGNVNPDYGFKYINSFVDILDANSDGYRLITHQGDSNDPAYNINTLHTMSAGVQGSQIASGDGYNEPGWMPNGSPRYKRMILHYDDANKRISLYADPDRDGTMSLMLQYDNVPATLDITELRLGGGANSFNGSLKLQLDNIRFDHQHVQTSN